MAKVSILIPVFNRQDLIEKTIRSALSQTIEDIEVIVTDNASTDGTFAIAVDLARSDSRLKLYKNSENIGPTRNWLKAISLASSNVSKLLFSDDLLSPTFLEKCLPPLMDEKCGLVYTPAIIGKADWEGNSYYQHFHGDAKIKSSPYIHATTFVEHLFPVSPCSCLARTVDLKKNIHLNLQGFEMEEYATTGAGVDWLFHPLTMLNYEYVQYIDSCEVFFRSHNGALTDLPITKTCYRNAKNFLISALNLRN